jgi:spore coat polysaccharide biosynthesis protein SpsF
MRLPRVVASIEARMGSSRLPGKVLMDIAGKPALSRLLDRLRAVPNLDDIVLATSTASVDDALVEWAKREKVDYFRGSEDDVLDRVVRAQAKAGSEIVVEVTGDCPLLCPDIIELGIETFHANSCDVVSNCGTVATFPQGADVQVFPWARLKEVADKIDDPPAREHVALYFYEHPEQYRIVNMVAPKEWREPDWRWQLDYPEDFEFITMVYRLLEPEFGPVFGIGPIMSLLRKRPELLTINQHCLEKAARP